MMVSMAALPLIGIAGLGTELGVMYVTKRHAQNAADSAAFSGALTLASGGATSAVQTAGKQFRSAARPPSTPSSRLSLGGSAASA